MDLTQFTLSVPKLNEYSLLKPQNLVAQVKILEKKAAPLLMALAHEVRNPLSNINLAVDMLQSTTNVNEQKLYLDMITRASGRITELIAELLTYHEADEIPPGEYYIHQILDEVLTTVGDRLALRNTQVTKYYSKRNKKIFVSKRRVKIALTNIIINAIDAIHAANGELKIITRSAKEKCIIKICDNGSGISSENLVTIFEPYFSNKIGGLGLGLSTTREILLANRAEISVQSEEGKGTCFIISFNEFKTASK